MADWRQGLDQLAAEGRLSTAEYRQALQLGGYRLDAEGQARALNRLLAVGGVLFILSGVLSFLAFNWMTLPAWSKLSLALGVYLLAGGAMLRGDISRLSGRLAVLATQVMTGLLFAVIGQVYQTGADAWNLFALWAVLILPLAVISRWQASWGLWVVVTLLALLLWQTAGLFDRFFGLFWPETLNVLLVAYLLLVLVGWEYFTTRQGPWWQRLAPRLLACLLAWHLFVPLEVLIFSRYEHYRLVLPGGLEAPAAPIVAYGLWFAVGWWFYQQRRRDLFMLALAAFSLEAVVLSLLGRDVHGEAGILFLSLVMILATAGIAWLLINRYRHWKELGDD